MVMATKGEDLDQLFGFLGEEQSKPTGGGGGGSKDDEQYA